jgi:hypothetical protein
VGIGRVLVPVDPDGNCLFASLGEVAGPYLQQLWGTATPPTGTDLRAQLFGVLWADYERELAGRPTRYVQYINTKWGETRKEAILRALFTIGGDGEWTDDAADLVLDMAAWEFGLPITLVQPDDSGQPRVSDHGPAGNQRYVVALHSSHYWATAPVADGTGVPTAAGLPTNVPEIEVSVQIATVVERFQALVDEVSVALAGLLAGPERTTRETRVAEIRATFRQIVEEVQPEVSARVQPASSYQQHRLARLRGLTETLERMAA